MFNNFISVILIIVTLSLLITGCSATNNVEEPKADIILEEQADIVLEEEVIETPIVETEEPVEIKYYYYKTDIAALAKVLYTECRGIPSTMEQACVAWTVLNRLDAGYADTVMGVLTAPNQFAYYENTPVDKDLYNLAWDVLTRWNNEKNGIEDVGRVLPPEYLYFSGRNGHNYFRNAYSGDFDVWDYSLPNPYED